MTDAQTDNKVQTALQAIEQAAAAKKLTAGAVTNLKRWLTVSGYRPYVSRILELVDAGKFEELDSLFWEVIPFGTGGRRGMMAEFGSATINDRTMAESANGLAVYLKKVKGQAGGRAVIAHDTRLKSRDFAKIVATTLAAHGLQVMLFDSHRSTPALSFAVRYLKCDVGAMISASHNPPSDNGIKAYWSSGAQVLPPHDAGIIECVYETNEIPTLDFDQAVQQKKITIIGEEVDKEYIRNVAALSLSSSRDIPALFSPLHGVGETSAYRVLQEQKFTGVALFGPQCAADGTFPNVPNHLPNPELTSVFDPIIPQAQASGAELVIASDPDADRLGVMVRDASGKFVHMTGNQVGAVLTDYVLRKRQAAGTLTPAHYVVETLVTTPLIAAVSRAYNVRIIDNLLVGFKYIAQTMDAEGPNEFVFGAEESLGYLAGQYARDKDASIAALYVAECAAELRKEKKTLLDRLDELFVQHGYYLETQKSETCKGPKGRDQIEQLMQVFGEKPPAKLGAFNLTRVRDYSRHEIRSLPDNRRVEALPHPEGEMLIFEARNNDCEISMAVRPSGTEPKIKFYFFGRAACPSAEALPAVRESTDAQMRDFQQSLSAFAKEVWAAEGK